MGGRGPLRVGVRRGRFVGWPFRDGGGRMVSSMVGAMVGAMMGAMVGATVGRALRAVSGWRAACFEGCGVSLPVAPWFTVGHGGQTRGERRGGEGGGSWRRRRRQTSVGPHLCMDLVAAADPTSPWAYVHRAPPQRRTPPQHKTAGPCHFVFPPPPPTLITSPHPIRLDGGCRWGDVLPWGAAAARLTVFAPPNASTASVSSLPFAPAAAAGHAAASTEGAEGAEEGGYLV